MDLMPLTEVMLYTLVNIHNHISDNIQFFNANAPDEILNLSMQLNEVVRTWSEEIQGLSSNEKILSLQSNENYELFTSVYYKIQSESHLSLIHSVRILDILNIRKNHFKK